MKIKALLVDDEQHCVDTLLYDLKRHCSEELEVVATASTSLEAIKAIESAKPDLVFMDIDLPGINGMQVLELFENANFRIVFVTAHSRYAVEGYKFKADAFLLKPVDPEELTEVIQRIYKDLPSQSNNPIRDGKLAIADMKGVEFVPYENIVYCESQNNYTCLYLSDSQQKVVSKTLKSIEEQLPTSDFIRIHQSYLINMHQVKKYLKADGGSVEMQNGQILSVSKRFKDKFTSLLS